MGRQVSGLAKCGPVRILHPLGQFVRRLPGRRVVHDQFGDAPEILDQHDPQGDRHGPQLADGQRLHRLVGEQVAAQRLGVEVAVRMRHQRPRRAKHPRQPGERPRRQLGQLRVVARRQVHADLAYLHVHEVVVVGQPFGGGGGVVAVPGCLRDGAVGAEQEHGVVGQAVRQPAAPGPARRHRLGGGEAPGVLLQALDAEQLAAQRRAVPGLRGRRLLGQAADDHRPACRDRRPFMGTASAPEQAAAILRRGRAGQQRVFARAGALVRAGIHPRFALGHGHMPGGRVLHRLWQGRRAIGNRKVALDIAHATLHSRKTGGAHGLGQRDSPAARRQSGPWPLRSADLFGGQPLILWYVGIH